MVSVCWSQSDGKKTKDQSEVTNFLGQISITTQTPSHFILPNVYSPLKMARQFSVLFYRLTSWSQEIVGKTKYRLISSYLPPPNKSVVHENLANIAPISFGVFFVKLPSYEWNPTRALFSI